jgi:hypothetical protein
MHAVSDLTQGGAASCMQRQVRVITCFVDFLDFLALGGRLRRLLLALEDIAVVDAVLLTRCISPPDVI